MKTVQEIRTELEVMRRKFLNELYDFIQENPNIKVEMELFTETKWEDCPDGQRLLTFNGVKSNLNIRVI